MTDSELDQMIDRQRERMKLLTPDPPKPKQEWPKISYSLDTSGESWWCDTHNRIATHICHHETLEDQHCCDPGNPPMGDTMTGCKCRLAAHEPNPDWVAAPERQVFTNLGVRLK